ncbi:hypothetical protein SAMN02927924_02798 [Sphingobium faniae]|nr:hypothetical protein SAMN02927924_02798 [Sphingobium faniae]
MSEWQSGVIMIATPSGKMPLPGWISEPFGLDWGLNVETGAVVWIVHHLPTGYNLMAVDHEIGDVVRLVDLLRSLGGWSFTEAAGVDAFKDTLQIVRASGFRVFNPNLKVGRPTLPSQLAEIAA